MTQRHQRMKMTMKTFSVLIKPHKNQTNVFTQIFETSGGSK